MKISDRGVQIRDFIVINKKETWNIVFNCFL